MTAGVRRMLGIDDTLPDDDRTVVHLRDHSAAACLPTICTSSAFRDVCRN